MVWDYSQEAVDSLQEYYRLISGPKFELWIATGESEVIDSQEDIIDNIQEETESITRFDDPETLVETFYTEAREEDLLDEKGRLTDKGNNFYARTERAMLEFYGSEMIAYRDDRERMDEWEIPGLLNHDNLRTIGEQYGVLSTPGVLEIGRRLMYDEPLDDLDPNDISHLLNKMENNGYVESMEAGRDYRLSEGGLQIFYNVIFGPGGDYSWVST